MIRKPSKKSPPKSAAKPAAAPEGPAADKAELDEQELKNVTGGSDNPGESLSLNFGQIKHSY